MILRTIVKSTDVREHGITINYKKVNTAIYSHKANGLGLLVYTVKC